MRSKMLAGVLILCGSTAALGQIAPTAQDHPPGHVMATPTPTPSPTASPTPLPSPTGTPLPQPDAPPPGR